MSRLAWFVALSLLGAAPTRAQEDPDSAPIHYHTAEVDDPVARLQRRLDSGEVSLDWHDRWGWLPSLLGQLEIEIDTQTLVFSKTSLQASRIAPHRPRALYYNDDVYVGYVQQGRVLEIASVDPRQGSVFYTIEQQKDSPPRFDRDRGECLACHHSNRTRDVPGLLVRSVFPDQRGHPLLSLGEEVTDPTTPLELRYGGWYVTGELGTATHRGNAVYSDPTGPDDAAASTPRVIGEERVASRYLTTHSDVVALMVLEHQSQMHNAITRASYEARRAEAYDTMWREILEKPDGFVFEVSTSRLDRAVEQLVECLLFSGEAPLPGTVRGSSGFAERFAAGGKRDRKGRSLRDLDLQTRLFRHPCSYLVHSESFAALPETVLTRVSARLSTVLRGDDGSPSYAHLTEADRIAIGELLTETGAPIELTL